MIFLVVIVKLCHFIDEVNYPTRGMPVQLRLTCDDNCSSCPLIDQFWAFSMAAQKYWRLELLPILNSLLCTLVFLELWQTETYIRKLLNDENAND